MREAPPGVAGLAEIEWWPEYLVSELENELKEWKVRDIGPEIRQNRKKPSANELKLLQESAKISATAVEAGMDHTLSNSERAGKAELVARMSGVEDIFVFCHTSTEEADTVEVISEYRGYWTIAARVI
ncbi:hypothetical protein, partial [Desertibacillus haloalkaliphilus]|uniref:hypothetical protein n=1 Tax=Desertibacillus haloalkaliphilus TaxID=1328930 RepID=UPI001C27BC87